MLCISAAIAGMRCPSVCLSVTFVSCAKTNKDIFEIFSPSSSQAILVFPRQTGWRYSDRNPRNRDVECRWCGKNAILNEYCCIQVYSVVNRTSREVWKIKPRRTVSSRALTAASVIRCSHKTTTNCLWWAWVIRRRQRSNPSGHKPLGHNSVFCCRRTL